MKTKISLLILTLVFFQASFALLSDGFRVPKHWAQIARTTQANTDTRTYKIGDSAVVLAVIRKLDSGQQKSETLKLMKSDQAFTMIETKNIFNHCQQKNEKTKFTVVCFDRKDRMLISTLSWKESTKKIEDYKNQLKDAIW